MGYSLKYIYHDCFVLETDGAVIVFDYWKDPMARGGDKDCPPLLEEIDPDKDVYFLVSHHHKDHFTRRIFLWSERFPRVHYVISEDTYKAVKYMFNDGVYSGHKPPREKVTVLQPGEDYKDRLVKIKAFSSTDLGNSYVVEGGGYRYFHAGDLNAWLWLEESTPEEIEEARNAYIRIIEEIRHDYPCLDLAMFPVDSRLGREYWWGAQYLVNHIDVKLFVPMHFELVLAEEDKEPRRLDAGAFSRYARKDYGEYLQLSSSRTTYMKNDR